MDWREKEGGLGELDRAQRISRARNSLWPCIWEGLEGWGRGERGLINCSRLATRVCRSPTRLGKL